MQPLVERSAQEFAAALDRELARTATEAAVVARLAALLRDAPRNWLAIEAVEGIATERGLAVPPDLIAARKALWEQDSGLLARAGDCLACAWDIATCSLTDALICNAPVTISPLGDVVGVSKAAARWTRWIWRCRSWVWRRRRRSSCRRAGRGSSRRGRV